MKMENRLDIPEDANADGVVSPRERFSFLRRTWRASPKPLRRGIVLLIGGTLVALGFALIVLPGPFTLPLIVAGLAVLATEFAWAESLLNKGRERLKAASRKVRRQKD